MAYSESLKKLFPNTSTIAYYSPFGQHIVLNSIEEDEYYRAMEDRFNPANLTIFKTIYHELKHWKDHHTTLWGLNSLVKIYNATNVRLLNDPKEFHHIVTYFRDAKKSALTEYYHTMLTPFDVKKYGLFWKWKLSGGSRFDVNGHIDRNMPIPFVRFNNPLSDELLSRTPLANSAFLEANAIAEELRIASLVISKLEEDTLIVEVKKLEDEYVDWIYNHELTLYSASTHIISSILGTKDIFKTFDISREISNLLLNLPEYLYDKIPINPYNKEFEDRELLKSQKDNGFAFLNLIFNYNDKHKGFEEFNISDLLNASQLPPKEELKKLIVEEFRGLTQKVIDGPFSQKVLKKIENAIDYFEDNGLDGGSSIAIDFYSYEKPPIIFRDTMLDDSTYDYEEFKSAVLYGTELNYTGWFLMHQDIYKELESFYNICGI